MKQLFVFVYCSLVLLFVDVSYAQPVIADTLAHSDTCFTEILIEQYYKTGGVIKPAEIKYLKSQWPYFYRRFTPSVEDIIKAEKFIRETLYMILAYSEYQIPKLEERLNNYHRQYIGIYNESGDKIVVIVMHDFTPFKNDPELYKFLVDEWRCLNTTEFFLIGNKNLPKYANNPVRVNHRQYRINLTQLRIEKGGSWLLDEYWFLGHERSIISDCD